MAIGTKAITLNMATKQERANRSMQTQEESEEQDNANIIDSNRKQFKAIAYNGFSQNYMAATKKKPMHS
jgi:hypothetical protein